MSLHFSCKMLERESFTSHLCIWFELLQHSGPETPDWIQELVKDELSFHGAMRILRDYGLVEVDKSLQEVVESQGYSIYGCVHSWAVHVLNQEWDYNLARCDGTRAR